MSADWEAVAELTGCRKLHGAQGPAPTISEMVAAFREDIDAGLKERPDMRGVGVTSLLATFLLEVKVAEARIKVLEDAISKMISLAGVVVDSVGTELHSRLAQVEAQRDAALKEADRLRIEEAQKPKRFPIQHTKSEWPHPVSIPWSIAELAYADYAARFGKSQSLERLAQRGGFCAKEMNDHLPGWRKMCEEHDRISVLYGLLSDALGVLEDAKRRFAPETTNSVADETIERIKLTLCKGHPLPQTQEKQRIEAMTELLREARKGMQRTVEFSKGPDGLIAPTNPQPRGLADRIDDLIPPTPDTV